MTIEQLESNLSPAAKHALETYHIAFKDGDPNMRVIDIWAAIRRLYGEKTYAEFKKHLEDRVRAVLPQ